MPVGTPGFVGARLKEAREARQMTGAVLSDMTGGVLPSAISAYENGKSAPTPAVFEQIARALNLKPEFFFRPEDEHSSSSSQIVFERSRASTTKRERLRARHQRVWLRESLRYLEQYIKMPTPDIPELQDFDWLNCSDSEIESIASIIRRAWKLGDGPISNVMLLVENHGVVGMKVFMKGRDMDAFSAWDVVDGRPYVALNSNVKSAFRNRFNVCHELGHLVLHRRLLSEDIATKVDFEVLEAQADRFAAAFLTPGETFSRDIIFPSLEMFRTIKSRWRVSIKMMIHRAHDLDIVDREEARKLYMGYNRRGWHKEEPLDTEYETEEPRLARRAFELVVDNAVVKLSQIAADLPFNGEEIQRLACLPIGFFDEESAYNLAIRELSSGFDGTLS